MAPTDSGSPRLSGETRPGAWRRAHPAREIDRRIVNLRGLEALDHRAKQMDRRIMEA